MTRAIAAGAAVQTIIVMRRSGFAVLSLVLSMLMGFAMAGCTASARDIEPIDAPAARSGNAGNIPIAQERSSAGLKDVPVASRSARPVSTDDVCLLTATRTLAHALKHRFDLSIGQDANTLNATPGRIQTNTTSSRLRTLLKSVSQLVAQQIRDWVLGRLS